MHFIVAESNKPSIEFYKRRGASDLSLEEGWRLFKIDKQHLIKMSAEEWTRGQASELAPAHGRSLIQEDSPQGLVSLWRIFMITAFSFHSFAKFSFFYIVTRLDFLTFSYYVFINRRIFLKLFVYIVGFKTF